MVNVFEHVILLFVIVFCEGKVQLKSMLLGLSDYYGSIYLGFTIFSLHNALYTGCPGGNVPDFGRMFLTLKYTDITQNTYIRS